MKEVSGNPFTESQAIRDLAHFRYALRRFLRFSEDAAREQGVTPQQHQLMLGIAGFTDRDCATISELAEFLQEKNHSVVGLVERAVRNGLVRRVQDSADRRVVVVSLTRRGKEVLAKLSALHQEQIREHFMALDIRRFVHRSDPAEHGELLQQARVADQ